MASTRPMVQRLMAAKPLTAPLRHQARSFSTTLPQRAAVVAHAGRHVSDVSSAQLAWLTAGTVAVVGAGIYHSLHGERAAIGNSFARRDHRNAQILAAIRDEAPLVGRPEDQYYPTRH